MPEVKLFGFTIEVVLLIMFIVIFITIAILITPVIAERGLFGFLLEIAKWIGI